MPARLSVSFALVALCCAGPVLAAPAASPAPAAEPAEEGSERICRVQNTIGSRLGAKRVCLTREEWRQQRRDHREETERAQTKRYYTDPAG